MKKNEIGEALTKALGSAKEIFPEVRKNENTTVNKNEPKKVGRPKSKLNKKQLTVMLYEPDEVAITTLFDCLNEGASFEQKSKIKISDACRAALYIAAQKSNLEEFKKMYWELPK